jgi:hypothetical protein
MKSHTTVFIILIKKTVYNRVDCPAQNGQGEPLTPPSIRVTYLAVRKEMG